LKALAIKLLALASFLGGPLYLADLLKPDWGQKTAFLMAFGPLALMLLGAVSLVDDPAERLGRIAVGAGVVGAILVALQHAFAGWQLWIAGADHPNRGLIGFGIVVGVPTVAAYLHLARRFLSTPRPSADPPPWDAPTSR
jgi:hypothetical protein